VTKEEEPWVVAKLASKTVVEKALTEKPEKEKKKLE